MSDEHTKLEFTLKAHELYGLFTNHIHNSKMVENIYGLTGATMTFEASGMADRFMVVLFPCFLETIMVSYPLVTLPPLCFLSRSDLSQIKGTLEISSNPVSECAVMTSDTS